MKVRPEQKLVEAKRLDPEWVGGRPCPVHIQYYHDDTIADADDYNYNNDYGLQFTINDDSDDD